MKVVIKLLDYRSFDGPECYFVSAMEGTCYSLSLLYWRYELKEGKIHKLVLVNTKLCNWLAHYFLAWSWITNYIYFCSIGNFFFAGARIFFQSLDAAIFLFSRVSDIPSDSLVLPVISTNDRLTLGCELQVSCHHSVPFTIIAQKFT